MAQWWSRAHLDCPFPLSKLWNTLPWLYTSPHITVINIHSKVSSSLNLLYIFSPFIFSCFSFYYVAILSYSLPTSLSCHICSFPFSVCHHKLPVISISPPQCHSLTSVCLLFLSSPVPPDLLHSFMSSRVFTIVQSVLGVIEKFIFSLQWAFISVSIHIHCHLFYITSR